MVDRSVRFEFSFREAGHFRRCAWSLKPEAWSWVTQRTMVRVTCHSETVAKMQEGKQVGLYEYTRSGSERMWSLCSALSAEVITLPLYLSSSQGPCAACRRTGRKLVNIYAEASSQGSHYLRYFRAHGVLWEKTCVFISTLFFSVLFFCSFCPVRPLS